MATIPNPVDKNLYSHANWKRTNYMISSVFQKYPENLAF